jgi:putative transcription factor
MICEMCGMEVPRLNRITIEGSILSVCQNCAKFGQTGTEKTQEEGIVNKPIIEQRLERREKRLKTKDVFETGQEELALDYPERIKRARASLGMSQKELGKKINEKKSVVAKLENGNMVPDEKLTKKLERALDISLKEKVATQAPPKHREESKSLTLGDFIKVENK